MRKITVLLVLLLSVTMYSQEGYNEQHQIKKINIELGKYYNGKEYNKYFYKFQSIKNDTLNLDRFTFQKNGGTHVWKKFYVPMKKMNIDKAKYKGPKYGILIRTKKKEKIIGSYLSPASYKVKKNYLSIHPHAGEEKDEEIMEMIITLFKNHK